MTLVLNAALSLGLLRVCSVLVRLVLLRKSEQWSEEGTPAPLRVRWW